MICVGVTAVVVAVSGYALVRSVSDDLTASLDADLEEVASNFTPQIVTGLANDARNVERTAELLGGNPTRGSFLGQVVFVLGDVPDVAFATAVGFDRVEVDGKEARRLTLQVRNARGRVSVEVFASLVPIEARIVFLRNRAILVGIAAVVASALFGALLARAVTRPLGRLRDEATAIRSTEDLDRRLAVGSSTAEVDEVASVLNNMLDRLEAETGRTRQSLEAARAFASDATHELRTPLTAVANNVEILMRHPELTAEERHEILSEINERQGAVTKVLGTLRDLARGDLPVAGHWQQVDLAELADSAIAALPRDDTLKIALDAGGRHYLDGWPDGLRVMLDNLLSNATTHGRALDGRAHVQVTVDSTESRVSLTIGDSGLGIASVDAERLQRRYERGDSNAGGTGLGLALVRQQVDLHAGRLTIGRSSLGGAEIKVNLPRVRVEVGGDTT